MRMKDIAEGAEYALGDTYQWDQRFRHPIDYTARGRVIEKSVLRTNWRGTQARDGVKVQLLDPKTGQALTTAEVAEPVKVLPSRSIAQDWAEFEAEHKAHYGALLAERVQEAHASKDRLMRLEALLGRDLDDESLPDLFHHWVAVERRRPGSSAGKLDAVVDLLEIVRAGV